MTNHGILLAQFQPYMVFPVNSLFTAKAFLFLSHLLIATFWCYPLVSEVDNQWFFNDYENNWSTVFSLTHFHGAICLFTLDTGPPFSREIDMVTLHSGKIIGLHSVLLAPYSATPYSVLYWDPTVIMTSTIRAQQIAGKNMYFCEPEGPQTTVLPRKKTIKINKLSFDLGLSIYGRFYLEF